MNKLDLFTNLESVNLSHPFSINNPALFCAKQRLEARRNGTKLVTFKIGTTNIIDWRGSDCKRPADAPGSVLLLDLARFWEVKARREVKVNDSPWGKNQSSCLTGVGDT